MTTQRFMAIALSAMAIAAAGTLAVCGEPPSPEAPRPAADSGRITSQMATDLTASILREVEALRGLSFKKPVPVKVIDDEEAREHMLARLKLFGMEDQMKLTDEAFTLLGLLPGKSGTLETVLDVMREQAGGFYDPVEEVFYLLEDLPVALAPMITAHELTHALEDQHFDLDARLAASIDDADRLFALAAVHEGSAMVVMSLFTAGQSAAALVDATQASLQAEAQEAQQRALEGLPPVLLRQLLGPYVLGAGFLARGDLPGTIGAGPPIADLDRAYAAGPQSSEQILHPEKYWDANRRDDPRDVRIHGVGDVLGPRWERTAEGVLGELVLGVLVGAGTPATDASLLTGPPAAWTNPAASGWGGDRWELWKRAGASVAVAVVEWDSAADAEEFSAALPRRGGLWTAHRGTRLVLVAGKPGRKRAALLGAGLGAGDAAVVPTAGNR